LQALVLGLVTFGFVLAFACSIELGAPAPLALALLLLTLSASANRFAARNDIHALWLLPLFAWILLRHARNPRAFIALLALGVLWSNLHSSFVLGWVLLIAAILERGLRRDRWGACRSPLPPSIRACRCSGRPARARTCSCGTTWSVRPCTAA
jgi:hypothetical protein